MSRSKQFQESEKPTFEERLRDEFKIELIKKIGEGAQAECWKAKHRDVGLCAVKMYHHRVVNDADETKIIGRELEAAQRFQNPSLILPLQNSYRIESTLLTRWMLGTESLQDIADRSPNGIDNVICDALFSNVAAALDLVHSADGDWVHADVKPSNMIMLGSLPCLSDFGTAYRRTGLTSKFTSTGRLGTRAYMPLSESDVRPTRFSDVYAFLVSYIYLRQGRHPLGRNENEVISNQQANRYDLKGIPKKQQVDLENALKAGIENSLLEWFTNFSLLSDMSKVRSTEQSQVSRKYSGKKRTSSDVVRMSVSDIGEIENVDARMIHSAALLEKLVRNTLKRDRVSEAGLTLGQMIQLESKFNATSFIKDLNFAVGIRNDIAHGRRNPSSAEKERAAKYLQTAILKLQNAPAKANVKNWEGIKVAQPKIANPSKIDHKSESSEKDLNAAPNQPKPVQQNCNPEGTFEQKRVKVLESSVAQCNPAQQKSKLFRSFCDLLINAIGLPLMLFAILIVIRGSFELGGIWLGLLLVVFAVWLTCKVILFGSTVDEPTALSNAVTRIVGVLFLFPLFIVPACIYWKLDFISSNFASPNPPIQRNAQTSLYGIPNGYFESKFQSLTFSDFGSPGSETIVAAGDDCIYAWDLKSKNLLGRYYQGTKFKDSWMNSWGIGRVNRYIIPKSLTGHTVLLHNSPASYGEEYWQCSFPSSSLSEPHFEEQILHQSLGTSVSSFDPDSFCFARKSLSGHYGGDIVVGSREKSFDACRFSASSLAKTLNFRAPLQFDGMVGDVFKFSLHSHAVSEDATRVAFAFSSTDLVKDDGSSFSSIVSALPSFMKPEDLNSLSNEMAKFETADGYLIENKMLLLIVDTKSKKLVSKQEIYKALKYGRPVKRELGKSKKYQLDWPAPEKIPTPLLNLSSNGEVCIVAFDENLKVFSGPNLIPGVSLKVKTVELGNFSKDSKFFCLSESNRSLKEEEKLRVFEVSSGRVVFERECHCFYPRIGGLKDEYIAGIVSSGEVCLFEWKLSK